MVEEQHGRAAWRPGERHVEIVLPMPTECREVLDASQHHLGIASPQDRMLIGEGCGSMVAIYAVQASVPKIYL